MKRLLLSLALAGACFMANAKPPAGEAKPGEWYGEKFDAKGAMDIAQIPAKLEKTDAIDTKIKAKILDVCPKK